MVVAQKSLLSIIKRGIMMRTELCIECDQLTGRAGINEDSLYIYDEKIGYIGSYCETCFEHIPIETQITERECR